MFETAVLSNGAATKRLWATAAGFSGHALLIGFALMAPIIWPCAIPRGYTITLAPEAAKVISRHGTRTSRPARNWYTEPVSVPKRVPMIVDDPADFVPTGGVNGNRIGIDDGFGDGDGDGLAIAVLSQLPAPRPPAEIRTAP